MNRCVIIGGAPITDYDAVRSLLNQNDYIIYCDCGLAHREKLAVEPNLIIGDFDSHVNPQENIETIVLPHEKDDTDTVFAAREAIKRGFKEFLLLGVIGGRFDHSLGNISILLKLDSLGFRALLADDYSEMEIVSGEIAEIPDWYSYFSLLNISGIANDVTITGAKYCLNHADITCEYPIGVSNEVIKGQRACVTVGEGRLLLIKVR